MKTVYHELCTCRLCRLGVRREVERVLRSNRRWMGAYTIMYVGRLGWVPLWFYLAVLGEMLSRGLLIASYGSGDPFPRFMLSSLLSPGLRIVGGGRDA